MFASFSSIGLIEKSPGRPFTVQMFGFQARLTSASLKEVLFDYFGSKEKVQVTGEPALESCMTAWIWLQVGCRLPSSTEYIPRGLSAACGSTLK